MEERQCLYHFPICPFCRKIRFILSINNVHNIDYKIENFWEKREKFININPTGEVPFLAIQQDDCDGKKNILLWGKNTIIEYLRKKYPVETLLYGDLGNQANILKYNELFDEHFYNSITSPILNERVYVFYKKKRNANLDAIKIARMNLESYIDVITRILQKRDYIATDKFSLADLSLACQISSLDYLGEIDWKQHQTLKEWYMPIKSKPAFRDILYDVISDFRPSAWYRELDF